MKLALASLIALSCLVTATPTKRDQFSDQALSLHNSNRAHYGAAPLKYDNSLAAGAASYAAQCHSAHSSGNYGENLFYGPGTNWGIQDAVKLWMEEAPDYDYNHPVYSHFTQIVWKATTTLGCASHHCTTGNPLGSGDWTYIICRYTPAGNAEGQFAQNVGRPQ